MNKREIRILKISLYVGIGICLGLGVLLLLIGFLMPIDSNFGGTTNLSSLGVSLFTLAGDQGLLTAQASSAVSTALAGFSFMIISIPLIITAIIVYFYTATKK